MARVDRHYVDDAKGPSGCWVYDGEGRALFELDQFERSDLVRDAIRSHVDLPGLHAKVIRPPTLLKRNLALLAAYCVIGMLLVAVLS